MFGPNGGGRSYPSPPAVQLRTAHVFNPIIAGTVDAYITARCIDELFQLFFKALYTAELSRKKALYLGDLRQKHGRNTISFNRTNLFQIRPSHARKICNEISNIQPAITAEGVNVLYFDELTWNKR